MSVTVEAAYFDRAQAVNNDGEYLRASVPYFVFSATDEETAIEAALTGVSETFNGLSRKSISIVERINDTTFKIEVEYESQTGGSSQAAQNESVLSFDTRGGTKHISKSLYVLDVQPAGASDDEGAIGFDGEHVVGLDIPEAVFNFSETKFLPPNIVNHSFLGRLARNTNKVNSNNFRGTLPGECRFLGASGQRRGADESAYWEITWEFAAKPNIVNKRVGQFTISANGWDYVDVRYAKKVGQDGATKSILSYPKKIIIHKIYERVDFGVLGL